jgi:hypothetical protein
MPGSGQGPDGRQVYQAGNPYSCMAAKNPFRTTLIAPCGMDCAICSAFLREKNRCNGCYGATSTGRRHCIIASCEHLQKRYSHTCGSFPCRRLEQLDKRYRTRYRMSMLDNLAAIRKDGIRKFVKSERERWTCSACGGTIDVHRYRCSSCGKEPDGPVPDR